MLKNNLNYLYYNTIKPFFNQISTIISIFYKENHLFPSINQITTIIKRNKFLKQPHPNPPQQKKEPLLTDVVLFLKFLLMPWSSIGIIQLC